MSIYTYKNLYRAYLDCREHKRKTVNALKFELDLERNLKKLLDELKSGVYQPGRSICFIVTEPCPREIFAADFRDRAVHHLFVRELIAKAEKTFIYDSYACRENKGTHKAVKRAYDFTRRLTVIARRSEATTRQSRSAGNELWYMKIDIKSFFMSIDKNILYNFVLDLIDKHKRCDAWKNEMADLAGIIIFHEPRKNYVRKGGSSLKDLIPPHKSLLNQPADKGLPIGNYSSQFFANLYLNKLDYFIKRYLGCKYYIRYVDDLLFMSECREQLKYCRDKIGEFLHQKLNLELNKNKTVIQPLAQGFDFLGYFIKQNKIYPRRSVAARYKNKLFRAAVGLNEAPWPKLQAVAASQKGHREYYN